MFKLLEKFKVLILCKYTFLKPPKADILLYDQGVRFNFLFKKSFKNLKFDIFYKRLEKINLNILIKAFFVGGIKKIKDNYLKLYIESVEPRIIITSNDVDTRFYGIKKLINKNIFTIVVQRNYREKKREKKDFQNFKLTKEHYICDYFFLFTKEQKKFYQKYITSKYFEIGSFSNNFHKRKIKKIKNQILFISQFTPMFINTDNYQHESKIIKYLIEVCRLKKMKLKIIVKNLVSYDHLSNNFDRSFQIYLKHFTFLNKSFFFIQDKSHSNYDFLDNNKLIVFADSQLGVEAASRHNRVLCVPKDILDIKDFNYDICSIENFSNFFEKVSQILKKSNRLYFNKNYKNNLLKYDEDNMTIKNLVKKLLKKI